MPFIPHTEKDKQEMLSAIGLSNIEELFADVPENLRLKKLQNIPKGLKEMEICRSMRELAAKNVTGCCFVGVGAYEHYIPAPVWEIAGRGEFLTAYTPYQAEASQGTLQVIYEYQTMMTNLMGTDVSNASLYDGASAVGEAALMAVRANRKSKSKKILIPRTLHPSYRKVAKTIACPQGIVFDELPYDLQVGCTDLQYLEKFAGEDIAAVVITQPNFFGVLEEVDAITNWAHARGALVVAVVNPIAISLLKEPGGWGNAGADIIVGDGQPLGVPLSSGGPYFGFMCCKKEYVRSMPGRIVGRTTDSAGNSGYVLTLQAREQHIRRSKATSNICTNQGLMVTAATIYMSLLGAKGLRQVAINSHANTRKLRNLLNAKTFSGPIFNEFVFKLNKSVSEVLSRLAEQGIQGGYNLTHEYPELGEAILVCATETKTEEDLNSYRDALLRVGAEL